MRAQTGFGKPKSKREPVEVAEPKPQDKSLDKLLGVRKQRLDRLERERKDAHAALQESRATLRTKKQEWRDTLQGAKDYWVQARKEFLSMATTSGQYQRAKGVYERMKQHAADLRLACLEAYGACKEARTAFHEARDRAVTANRQQEKLTIMRDEIRLQQQQSEA